MRSYGKFDDYASLRRYFERKLRKHLMNVRGRSEGTKRYRFEHCLRVARIGRRVAEAEGLDPELLELGCMMHDYGKWDAVKPVDHGRAGAIAVRDLLLEAELDERDVAEITQGIAMHTDGLYNARTDKQGTKADAEGRPYLIFGSEPTVLARSIGDCDNVDRFSTYRIYDTLRHFDFLGLTSEEQIEWITGYIGTLREQREYQCATETCQKMWIASIGYQEQFMKRLLGEIVPSEL